MNILIIDDDEFKRECIIDAILEVNKKAKIRECEYRNEGLKELKDNTFDLLFLDMQFPNYQGGMIERTNGLSVLRELKRTENNIPVVICSSGYTDCSEYNIKNYVLFGSNSMSEHFKHIIEELNNDK